MGNKNDSNLSGDRVIDYYAVAYSLLILLLLSLYAKPGIFYNDENGHILSADSLSRGTLTIWNGLEEYDSLELGIYGTLKVGDRLYPVPSPLYAILVQPLYLLLGLRGLILANTLSFAANILLVYLVSFAFYGDRRFSLFAAVFYSLFTYSMAFSLDVWPHMMSSFLVLASFYLALGGRPFFSGFVAGLSVGVRYPDALIALVVSAFVFYRLGRSGLVKFFLGALLPVAVLLAFNFGMYGGLTTAYTTSHNRAFGEYYGWDVITPYLFLLSLTSAAAYVLAKGLGKSARPLSWCLVAVLVLCCVFFVLDSSFPQKLWRSIVVAYSDVFDMQSQPIGGQPIGKKSLLQASPVLVLCLLAPFIVKKKAGGLDLAVLSAIPAMMILFFSVLPMSHDDVVPFVRFLFDCMPFLAVMAAAVSWELKAFGGSWQSYAFYIPLLSLVLMSLQAFQMFHDVMAMALLRAFPLSLALSLLVFGAVRIRTGRHAAVFSALVFLSAAYGLSVNLYDTIDNATCRGVNLEFTEGMGFVEDNSAVFYGSDRDVTFVGPLKLAKSIRLVEASADNMADSAGLLSSYYGRRIPVYLFDSGSEGFEEFIRTNISLYDHRVIREEYPKIYLVKAGI